MLISNEFATVDVEFDTNSHDPRLRIEDVSSGMCIYLDALELQALAWARHEDLRHFTRPLFKELAAERILGRVVQAEAVEQAESILRQGREDE